MTRIYLIYHRIGDYGSVFDRSWINYKRDINVLSILSFICKLLKTKSKFVITFDDGYKEQAIAARWAARYLKQHSILFIVSSHIDESEFINKKTLQRLSCHPLIEIGSHTRSHSSLINDDIDLVAETEFSAQDIKKLTGTRPKSFAFPYGEYSDKAVEYVRKAGYLAIYNSIRKSSLKTRASELIPRFVVTKKSRIVLLIFGYLGILDWVYTLKLTLRRRNWI